jgi:hypothetical protein
LLRFASACGAALRAPFGSHFNYLWMFRLSLVLTGLSGGKKPVIAEGQKSVRILAKWILASPSPHQ